MRQKDRSLFFICLAAMLWPVVVFIGYVYLHKPFSTTQLLGILQSLWQIIVVLLVISLAGGIGVLTRLRDMDIPPVSRAVLASALGLGAISTAVLLIGATIGVNFFLWICLIAGLVMLRKQIVLWWSYWGDAGNSFKETSKLGKMVLLLLAVILLCELMKALAPPLWYDALVYHLTIPKEFVQLGRITYLPDNMGWGYAGQIETLYVWVMYLGGTETATVLGWALGVMTLMAIADFTAKLFNTETAWVTVASLMCGSAFTGLLSSGYIDWEAMLFSLAMLICLMEWAATKKLTELGFAGVFAGLAFSTKYTAGFVSLPAALVILLASRNHFSLKELARKFLLFGGAALAVSLPWLAKNALATGNPFYPLFIPAGAMDTIRLSLLQNQPVQDWSRLILLPWQITVWGIDGRTGFGWSIGPLLLGLSPLAMIHWKNYNQFQQRALGIGATIVLSTFLLWAVGSQFSLHLLETRYYFPNFTAWAMLCGAGFFTVSQIEFRGVRVKFILGAFILLALGFNAFSVVENTVNAHPLKALLGDESREAYVENSLGAYEPAMLAVQALPEGAHVLLLWEARGYGCLLRCDSDEIIDRWRHDWDAYRNPDQIIAEWKSQGYTHVLLNHAGKDFIATSDPLALPPDIEKGLDATLARLTLSKSLGGIYEIYTLP